MAELDWSVVDRIGRDLGVSYRARQKWKQRNCVPHKYRIAMIQATGGVINAQQFAVMDGNRQQTKKNNRQRSRVSA